MKIGYYNKVFLTIFFIALNLSVENVFAQNDTLFINDDFQKINLKEASSIYSSKDASVLLSDVSKNKLWENTDNKKEIFFDINSEFNAVLFTIKNNSTTKQSLILELFNVMTNEILFFEKKDRKFNLINKAGTNYLFSARMLNDKNFLYPISFKPNEIKTLAVQIKTIKTPSILPGTIWNEKQFQTHNKLRHVIIGLYFGLSFISILISLFIFYFLRKSTYLIYALYIIALGFYLFSYLGLFFQFFVPETSSFNKYIHVFFIVMSLVLFVIFSQKVLNAKKYIPKFKKFVDILLIIIIVFRFSEFFYPTEFFLRIKPIIMRFWYLSFFILSLIIIIEIIASYKKQREVTTFFTISFFFMFIGSMITVLHHGFGLVGSYIYGLPIVFYTSILEIIFLTFTIVSMVKKIYDERNILSGKLVHQQQRFLTAFIDGQEKERERISKELHDNVGSKLSNFKRFFLREYPNKKMENQIDIICKDVRELSHQLTPSEIKLVGLPGAISDLITKYTDDGLTIEFNCYEFPENISKNITSHLYRIIQESLNNVIKHAEANSVDVQLIGHKDYITLTIEDDGKGFNNSIPLSGIGLHNIKSRIEQLKGNFLLDTSLNKGTSILITVPIS